MTAVEERRRACGGEPERPDSLRAFGEVLRSFRKRAGLTQEELAEMLQYSAQTVASIEQGRRFPSADFIERAEEVLDAFGTLRAAARHLSRRTGLADWFRQWASLETEALTLYTYECRLIPGLLQTESYARALFADRLPPLCDEEIDSRLAARTDRQRLLRERPNTAYSFIIEEHVFTRHTGGADAARAQIDHILDLARLRNIEVQVMPLTRGSHAGLDGPMRLLETPDNKQFGYCEGQEFGQFLTDPKVISMLHMRYARMRSQALTLEDSLSLLQRIRGAA
jgi:transcriptional regulator with XRE-family HTH domain